eukprot:CAMPEP_0167815436 /NCGR_PEP_ID=MMETSP0112_2-20121227/3019_1 /TAXON_ID=91324 /ORGANISM="Lotharella globosa, Strain CCCM811" /LENGTH=1130 /DNA_ID=CAMNT_0007714851 /DNA_START=811 /DNA_END=4203 /DNA_ORIENTATION=+
MEAPGDMTNGGNPKIDLSYTDLDGKAEESTSRLVPGGNKTVTLWDCRLGDLGLAVFCARLVEMEVMSLLYLDLWGNSIGDGGCEPLARVLMSQTCSLREIHLWNNQIGDVGAKKLAKALQRNRSLTCLNLWRNKISESGATHFIQALKSNKTLTQLDLGRCEVSDKTLEQLQGILEKRQPGPSAVPVPTPEEGHEDSSFADAEGWGDTSFSPCHKDEDPMLSAIRSGEIGKVVLGEIDLSKFGCDFLNEACEYGHLDIVRMLIEAKVSINFADPSGTTALHVAARHGRENVVTELLKSKANPCREDRFRRTPFDLACPSIRTMMAKSVADMRNAEAEFLEACGGENVSDLHKMLDYGVAVDARSDAGHTGLMLAAQKGASHSAQLLLESRAAPDAVEIDGWSALHYACREGHASVVKLLLEAKADTNKTDRELQFTSLHCAAEGGHVEIIRKLLAAGANVEKLEAEGKTALHIAADNGGDQGPNLVRVLLEYKASPKKTDNSGKSALHWAAPYGSSEIMELLLDFKGDPNQGDNDGFTSLHTAIAEANIEVAELLLDAKADPEAKDNEGRTSVHLAAREGYDEALMVLAENGADTNAKDLQQRTPLHWACAEGHEEFAQELLTNNVDPTACDASGRTALHAAVLSGNEMCVEIVLENGGVACAAVVDVDGKTPYALAMDGDNEDIAPILEDYQADIRPPQPGDDEDKKSVDAAMKEPVEEENDAPEDDTSVTEPVEQTEKTVKAATEKSVESNRDSTSPKRGKSPAKIVVPGTLGVGELTFKVLGANPTRSRNLSTIDEDNAKVGPCNMGEVSSPLKSPEEKPEEKKVMAEESKSGHPKPKPYISMTPTARGSNRPKISTDYADISLTVRKKFVRRSSAPPAVKTPTKSPDGTFGNEDQKARRQRSNTATKGLVKSHQRSRSSVRSYKRRMKLTHELEIRDPQIQRTWERINDPKEVLNWMLLGVSTDLGSAELQLVGSGSGGLREFVTNLLPDQVMWGIVKVKSTCQSGSTNRKTIVFFTHIGEKVGAFDRAKATVRTPGVMQAFNNISLHLQGEDDYRIDTIGRELLRRSSVEPIAYNFGPEQSIQVSELKSPPLSPTESPNEAGMQYQRVISPLDSPDQSPTVLSPK